MATTRLIIKAALAEPCYEVAAVAMERALAEQVAVEVIEQLEKERSTIIAHYLVLQELSIALSKYASDFPIVGIDPITMSLMREINRVRPGLSSRDQSEVRFAIGRYLLDNDWADRFFERQATFPKQA